MLLLDSSAGGLAVFTGLVAIAAAVLQIILFFKLWQMTDDVRHIKERLDASQRTITADDVVASAITGDSAETYNAIVASAVAEMNKLRRSYVEAEGYLKAYNDETYKRTMESNERLADEYLAKAARRCRAMGRELPPQLTSFKAYIAFYNDVVDTATATAPPA